MRLNVAPLDNIRTTYLNYIEGSTRLGSHSVLMDPKVGKTRHVELAHALIRQADKVCDVILHGDSKAITQHGRSPQAFVQLVIKVLLELAGLQVSLETADQRHNSFVDGVALSDRDVSSHVPGKLAQSADHAFVRALRTVAREWRLRNALLVNARWQMCRAKSEV